MDQFIIEGGRPLKGTVKISGSKNAALPILIATLLTDDPCVIDNVPNLRDIRTTFRLLESLGKRVEVSGSSVRISAARPLKLKAPYDLVKQMRASVLVAGPLLARFGRVCVPLPGGCAIGMRPIDIHLKGFETLGAKRIVEHGDVVLSAPKLRAARVAFKFPSVGATENLMMAASLVSGRTRIVGAAREPEIEDLAVFLNAMGASIKGAGTSTIEIKGVDGLMGVKHTVIPDRIEAGTFLLACAAAGGRLRLEGACGEHLKALTAKLRSAGAKVTEDRGGMSILMMSRPKPAAIETKPYPGFPTDLQAPWLSLMCLSSGTSKVIETVFENRFLHAAELGRMGALIDVSGHTARILGISGLHGAPIMASDIRAGAALIVAAVAAKGKTILQRVYHIDRGYEKVESKLRKIGVSIRRVSA